jgi:hypothetical protein
MWPWLRLGRRRPTIPDNLWADALSQIPYAAALPPADRQRLRGQVLDFLHAKTFEAAAGLTLTDAMRVQVALQACLLTLNLDPGYYDGWRGVILYPGDFLVPKEHVDDAGVVHEWTEELAGESWEHGPVILSWDASRTVDRHTLDMRDGHADGCPPLPASIPAREWRRDFRRAYDRFCDAVDRDEPTDLDPYAAESPAEFFAVASEVFFMDPAVVAEDFPAVYRQLRAFYDQDPLAVLAQASRDRGGSE